MNIISTCSFACTTSVIYKKKRTLSSAVTGLVTGRLMMVLVMLLWNYLITPIYMGYPREAVVKLLVPAFLPFNLLKAGLNAGFAFLLYKPMTTALRKAGYISDSQNMQSRKPLHTLSGKVIHGRGIGKLVGMPTANMELSDESTLPPFSVYITEILLDGQVYYGITNIGTRPTVDNEKEISVETHILYMPYSAPDIAYTKEQIYEAVWHEPSNGCCHAVGNTIF